MSAGLRALIASWRVESKHLQRNAEHFDGCNGRPLNPKKQRDLRIQAASLAQCVNELEAALDGQGDATPLSDDGGLAETERRHEASCRRGEAQREREALALASGFELGKAAGDAAALPDERLEQFVLLGVLGAMDAGGQQGAGGYPFAQRIASETVAFVIKHYKGKAAGDAAALPARKLHIAFNVANRRAGGTGPACDGPDCQVCADLLKAAGDAAPRVAASQWQPIETAPKDEDTLFWIQPKTADESYCDSSGKPIVGAFEPYIHMGCYGTWSALSKATHWMPLPAPPATSGSTQEKEKEKTLGLPGTTGRGNP